MLHRQTGVGLIEILITVVLLSVGFLTMASMQVQGMRFSQSAYFKSQASFMASDMVDRMRANIEGVKAGHYDGLTTSAGTSDPGCRNKLCAPAEVAKQDLYDWSAYLHPVGETPDFLPLLPGGDSGPAQGTVVPMAPGQYSVRLSWVEMLDGEMTIVPVRLDFVTEY